jgi:hypothetical protein
MFFSPIEFPEIRFEGKMWRSLDYRRAQPPISFFFSDRPSLLAVPGKGVKRHAGPVFLNRPRN